jgi:hypothetical protein
LNEPGGHWRDALVQEDEGYVSELDSVSQRLGSEGDSFFSSEENLGDGWDFDAETFEE